MGKQKYNHKIGDTYVTLNTLYGNLIYFICHIVDIVPTSSGDKYIAFKVTIELHPRYKFMVSTSKMGRTTLNGYAKGVSLEQFEQEHRLEPVLFAGRTLQQILEDAKARYAKHKNTRYSQKFDPDKINMKLGSIEETQNE